MPYVLQQECSPGPGQRAGARPTSGAPAHRSSICAGTRGVHARTPLNAPRETETRNSSPAQVFGTRGALHARSAAVTAGNTTCVPGVPCCRCCRTPGLTAVPVRVPTAPGNCAAHLPARTREPHCTPSCGFWTPGGPSTGSLPNPQTIPPYSKRSFLLEDFRIHLSASQQFPNQTRPKGLGFWAGVLF